MGIPFKQKIPEAAHGLPSFSCPSATKSAVSQREAAPAAGALE